MQLLSRFDMPKSKAQIAKYARGWRKDQYTEKRFNKPMKEFLQLKYRDIFNEYQWFYKLLDENHPNSKDLTKTKTFKNWKTRQLNCESSEEEQTQSETNQDEVEAESNQSEVETVRNEPEFSEVRAHETEQVETSHPDILSVAIDETLPENDNNNNIDIDNIEHIIQEVINELEQDQAVRELLNNEELVHPNYQDEDEGIDLDVETELAAIIEPFDYEEELEGFDY